MAIAVVGMLDEREEALSLIKERIEQRGHKALVIDISIGTGAIVPSLKADIGYNELSELGGGPSGGVAGYRLDRGEEAISIIAKRMFETNAVKLFNIRSKDDFKIHVSFC